MRAGSTSDGEKRGGQSGAGEQENDKQREVEQEKDEHGQNKWEEVKGTEQVCVAEDWQMGTHKEVKVKQVEDISLRVQPIVSQ